MGLPGRIWQRLTELRAQSGGAPPLTAGSVASMSTPTDGSEPEQRPDNQVSFAPPTTAEPDYSPPRSNGQSRSGADGAAGDGAPADGAAADGAAADGAATDGLRSQASGSDGSRPDGSGVDDPAAAGSGEPRAVPPPERAVPRGLQVAAAWAWRLILVAALVYGLGRVFGYLSEVLVPVAIAILLAAMLDPIDDQLRRWGLHRGPATAVTVLGGLAVIAGALTLITTQIVSQASVLSDNVGSGFNELAAYLQNGPLHVGAQYFRSDLWIGRIRNLLADSQSSLAGYAAEVGTRVGQFLAGFAITLFSLFYFLYDGRGIFEFLLRFVPREVQGRVDHAAGRGWRSLSHYVRATILVALSDAIGILIFALILKVPVAPALAALVFIGAFVPLVGAFVSGFVAVAVAFVAVGWIQGLIMFAAIILVMQIEGHVLQPFLLGRAVKLHPLAVLLAIAAGIIVDGIVGALIAVPVLAFSKSFVQYLMGAPDPVAVRFRWPAGSPRH